MHTQERDAYIAFIEADLRAEKLSKDRAAVEAKLADLDERQRKVDREYEQAIQSMKEAQKAVDLCELELRDLKTKRDAVQQKLMTVTSQKELTSLEHEQADLEKRHEAADENGLAALDLLEKAHAHKAAIEQKLPDKRAQIDTEWAELKADHEHLDRLLSSFEQEKESFAQHVPAELVAEYGTKKETVSNPVVNMRDGACSACFTALTPASKVRAEQGAFVVCQGCYRTVYAPVLPNKEESEHVGTVR